MMIYDAHNSTTVCKTKLDILEVGRLPASEWPDITQAITFSYLTEVTADGELRWLHDLTAWPHCKNT